MQDANSAEIAPPAIQRNRNELVSEQRAKLPRLIDAAHPDLHQLLSAAVQRADECWQRRAAEQHIDSVTARQFAMLQAISDHSGACQMDLTSISGIDRSTAADIIRRLVRAGLIQRRRTRRDARAYAVRLTERGEEILPKARVAAQAACNELLTEFSNKDAGALLGLLQRLTRAAG